MIKNLLKRFFSRVGALARRRQTSLKLSGVYGLILVMTSLIFYYLIPVILNYPAGTVGGSFQMELENADYTSQFLQITLIIFLFSVVFFFIRLSDIDKWEAYVAEAEKGNSEPLDRVRRKCMTLPYNIYIIQIIIPSLLIPVMHIITINSLNVTSLKLMIVFFSFITLAAVLTLIFAKRIFTSILLKISSHDKISGIRIGLQRKIFIQIIPMFIMALLFTSMIGYSRLVKEKGDILFELYKTRLETAFSGTGSDAVNESYILEKLGGITLVNNNDEVFLVSPEGNAFGTDNKPFVLSSFFTKYLNELSPANNGRVYDYYGFDTYGSVIWLDSATGKWVAGVIYVVGSSEIIAFFLLSFSALLALNILILSYFSRTLADDISMVAKSLADIAEGVDIDFEKSLTVTSRDEIGDLVIAFNKIQQREKDNIKSIKDNQEMLMEQERLASLGQLIGGIAHNLKTPIMSLSGAIEALKDLTKEYDESIEDNKVTNEDHHEIAAEMDKWLEKMKPHCAYMSDIITTVKGQAIQLSTEISSSFTVEELVNRIDILMKHELNKYHCTLKTDINVNRYTMFKGEVSNLVQVFDNIIINAIQAYDNKSGVIDLHAEEGTLENTVLFSMRDYAGGINDEVKAKLFKEMVTTKGKNGTGLGLYMSYSTIRGRFGGNMWFESELGKGTIFYILLPCINNSVGI
jgi:signal transduction histidine kinase